MKRIINVLFALLIIMVAIEIPVNGDEGNRETKYNEVKVVKLPNGDWQLMVNGQPYFVKGVTYSPHKVGQDPNQATLEDWMIADYNNNGRIDGPYDAWVDKNQNNKQDNDETAVGDFQLLREMGCNTIRLYHHASDNETVKKSYIYKNSFNLYDHPLNKELLRALYSTYGIRVIMGDFLGAYTTGSGAQWEEGTDYRDETQQENMMNSVRDLVLEHKDEDYVLFWMLGNENNYARLTHTNAQKYPEVYAKFVNEVAKMIHRLDPNHPVAICNGDLGILNYYVKFAPEIDIFGVNVYRGPHGFGDLWRTIKNKYNRPVLITEYGTGLPIQEGKPSESKQAEYHQGCWNDIVRNQAGKEGRGNAIGGVIYTWVDIWWLAGNSFSLELPEQYGICSQGDGLHSPFLREPREAYYLYRKLWRE
jgi:beta-glucuronidase